MADKINIDDMQKSKEVAEIINNSTCRKIIDYLKEKETSEVDIAKALNLPLSTVHYNVQKLLKNGFIEAKKFYWSEKGNKVYLYKSTNKVFVFSHEKPKYLENKVKIVLLSIIPALLIFSLFISGVFDLGIKDKLFPQTYSLEKFESCDALNNAFKEASEKSRGGMFEGIVATIASGGMKTMAAAESAAPTAPEYSETNIQVEGVDEADIVKTDGAYIYTLSKGRLIIARAYPANDAEILSETDLGTFSPQEIFIDKDRLLIFGSTYEEIKPLEQEQAKAEYYPYSISLTTAKLFDISDKASPEVIKTADFEGSYLTSRKINDDVYFVINSYPRYYAIEEQVQSNETIVPLYRESLVKANEEKEELKPECGCGDVNYFDPIDAQSFITIASMSMKDENAELSKKVIVGSGENVYASLQNLYVAQMNYPHWFYYGLKEGEKVQETTIVHKFSLNKGEVEYKGNAEAPGHILNQFSMDEYNDYFRIATTKEEVWQGDSTNNVYIFNENLNMTGKLEDLAPGEKIYSVRFMGNRGYIVTFKKIDPLFVIDLSNPEAPAILGKLKIPGYSDYLHPYDENHIIGIGKEAVDAEQELIQQRNLDFAWYQGMKIALFDVSDVENPIEMHKEVIGDRGTDSEALQNHKAFLFNKEKNLLVIPVLLAEIKNKETASANTYGDYVFQGAYVYRLTLENGFELKGRVTHYDSNETFEKSGYYFHGDDNVQRSLFIDDVLYTLSNNKIRMNNLETLEELKTLTFTPAEEDYPIVYDKVRAV